MAALRGNRLWRIPVDGDQAAGQPEAFFVGDYGRMRTVVTAPDGNLWVTTSNRDGRGDPPTSDDRILVVSPTAADPSPAPRRTCRPVSRLCDGSAACVGSF